MKTNAELLKENDELREQIVRLKVDLQDAEETAEALEKMFTNLRVDFNNMWQHVLRSRN